jgi:ribonuclease BN (tRNA processing enzyme)
LRDGEADAGVCRIFSRPLAHTERSIGFRVATRAGTSVAYSGDTDDCGNMIELGRGADILLIECSAPDGFKAEGHLTPSLAGKIATEAGAKRLVLTHFYPICDRYPILKQAKGAFKGKIILAKDGMRLRF